MVGFMNGCVHPFVDDGTNTVHPSHVVGIIEHFDAPPTRERLITTFLVHTTDDRDNVVRCLGRYGLLAIGHNVVKGVCDCTSGTAHQPTTNQLNLLESQDPEVEQHSSSTDGPTTKGPAMTEPTDKTRQARLANTEPTDRHD
jgi:hypothetical protein